MVHLLPTLEEVAGEHQQHEVLDEPADEETEEEAEVLQVMLVQMDLVVEEEDTEGLEQETQQVNEVTA